MKKSIYFLVIFEAIILALIILNHVGLFSNSSTNSQLMWWGFSTFAWLCSLGVLFGKLLSPPGFEVLDRILFLIEAILLFGSFLVQGILFLSIYLGIKIDYY